jgi:predicted Rossmann fold nucleotide-binding protein DprA/Smf involved in DNA uptake
VPAISKQPTLKSVGIIGARNLPFSLADKVGTVTEYLLEKNYHIATGGAIGADQFCIERLLRLGQSDHCTIYAPWRFYKGFPRKTNAMIRQFKQYGGNIVWGLASGDEPYYQIKLALLKRNINLVDASYGIVAFITAQSKGSIFTIKQAVKEKKVIVVFPHNCSLPFISNVKWVALRCGGVWENGFKGCLPQMSNRKTSPPKGGGGLDRVLAKGIPND